MTSDVKIWIGALLTLAAFSWVVKQNPAYVFAERLFIGLGAGYSTVVGIDNITSAGFQQLSKGNYVRLIPLALGVMLLSSLFSAWRRNRAFPMTVLVGVGTGLSMRTVMQTQFLKQIQATWVKMNSLDSIIIVVGSISVLAYFIFTYATNEESPQGRLRVVTRNIGMWVLMATFGSAFATAVQARLSGFIARLQFLFGDWITIFK
jgi:hypothetical protein